MIIGKICANWSEKQPIKKNITFHFKLVTLISRKYFSRKLVPDPVFLGHLDPDPNPVSLSPRFRFWEVNVECWHREDFLLKQLIQTCCESQVSRKLCFINPFRPSKESSWTGTLGDYVRKVCYIVFGWTITTFLDSLCTQGKDFWHDLLLVQYTEESILNMPGLYTSWVLWSWVDRHLNSTVVSQLGTPEQYSSFPAWDIVYLVTSSHATTLEGLILTHIFYFRWVK